MRPPKVRRPRSQRHDTVIRSRRLRPDTVESHGALDGRHYTVDEIAEAWKISRDKARRLFQNEPGVLVLDNRGGLPRRRYRTLRIPDAVAERVYRRLLNK